MHRNRFEMLQIKLKSTLMFASQEQESVPTIFVDIFEIISVVSLFESSLKVEPIICKTTNHTL